MTRLRVKDWNDRFESAKSREYKIKSQTYMPNKQGLGYTRLMRMPNAPAIYGAWVAMINLLSRQEKPRHGYLTDSGRPSGYPWTSEDIAIQTLFPVKVIASMLEIMATHDIGWLEVVSVADTEVPAPGAPPRIPDGPPPSPPPLPLPNTSRAYALARRLALSIGSWKPDFAAIGPSKIERTCQSWAADIDKAMRLDNRSPEAIERIIDWLPSHQGSGGFCWRVNILSGAKLRQQFDKLEMANTSQKPKPGGALYDN